MKVWGKYFSQKGSKQGGAETSKCVFKAQKLGQRGQREEMKGGLRYTVSEK